MIKVSDFAATSGDCISPLVCSRRATATTDFSFFHFQCMLVDAMVSELDGFFFRISHIENNSQPTERSKHNSV